MLPADPAALAYYLHNLDPFALRLTESFGIRWYGLAYAAAFLFGYLWFLRLARRRQLLLTPGQTGDFLTWSAVLGVLAGGRLGYMLLYQPEMFRDPLSFFRVWEGGMASHGGIAGLALVSLWYARRHNIPWFNLGDALVTAAPIGIFFGRIANFINGELYGRPAAVPWAVQFPGELPSRPDAWLILQRAREIDPSLASPADLAARGPANPALAGFLRGVLEPRHPSQLYEAFAEGLLLFLILWAVRALWPRRPGAAPHNTPPCGVLSGLFLILYALARIACEHFREPDAPLVGPLTRGQFYSLFMILAGTAILFAALRRPAPPPPGDTPAPA